MERSTIFNGKINDFYGKHTNTNGTSPFLMGKSTISMVIFNSELSVITRGGAMKLDASKKDRGNSSIGTIASSTSSSPIHLPIDRSYVETFFATLGRDFCWLPLHVLLLFLRIGCISVTAFIHPGPWC